MEINLNFMKNMNIENRRSVNDDLTKYDYLAKKDDFIEVTEWTNGEGYDISLNERIISLSNGQLDAINYLINALDYESRGEKTI